MGVAVVVSSVAEVGDVPSCIIEIAVTGGVVDVAASAVVVFPAVVS